MVLLSREFRMNARIKRAVLALCQFVVLIYGKYFLQCPLGVAAARLDRKLWQDLVAYQAVYPNRNSLHWKIAEEAKKSFERHPWYLMEPTITFALFDEDLSTVERRAMADTLLATPRPQQWLPGKPVLRTNHFAANPHAQLNLFMGPQSWLLFEKFTADTAWLRRPVQEWSNYDDYKVS